MRRSGRLGIRDVMRPWGFLPNAKIGPGSRADFADLQYVETLGSLTCDMRAPGTKKQVERLAASPPAACLAVLVGVVLLLPGCDLAEEEDLGRLAGSWQVTGLSVDGTSVTAQLDAQYDRLVLTLRRGADGRDFFSLTGRREGEGGVRTVQGTFDKDGSELTLRPRQGSGTSGHGTLPGPIEFDYAVSSSEEPPSSGGQSSALFLELRAEEGRSEDALLDLIRLPIQGAVDRARVHLSKG